MRYENVLLLLLLLLLLINQTIIIINYEPVKTGGTPNYQPV